MADWLHCNMCFLQPGKGTPFHITSCGHIYCDRCLLRGSKDNCKMCASKCSTMELSGKMKPDVEIYFQDPFDQLSKAFKKFMQTWEFQRNHRRRFFTHLTAKVLEQNQMLMEAKKMVTSAQALEREAMKLKEENIYLKKLVQEKDGGHLLAQAAPQHHSEFPPVYLQEIAQQDAAAADMDPLYQSTTLLEEAEIQAKARRMNRCGLHGGLVAPPHGISSCNRLSQMTSNATPDRILARTPPSGGRMGTVGSGSPADHMMKIHHKTPQSVPHPISFHGDT